MPGVLYTVKLNVRCVAYWAICFGRLSYELAVYNTMDIQFAAIFYGSLNPVCNKPSKNPNWVF